MRLETSHDAPQIAFPTLLQGLLKWDWMGRRAPQLISLSAGEAYPRSPRVHGSSVGMETPAGPGLDAPGCWQGSSTPAPKLALMWERAVGVHRTGVPAVTAAAGAQDKTPTWLLPCKWARGGGLCPFSRCSLLQQSSSVSPDAAPEDAGHLHHCLGAALHGLWAWEESAGWVCKK